MAKKNATSVILGSLLLFSAVSVQGVEFFSEDRYDQMAAMPGSSLGAPSGMVSGWGSVFVALGGLTHTPGADRTDGSLAFGMGMGDAVKSVGSAISLSIGSVSPDGGAGERGALNFSIGKFFTGPQLGIALGAVNVAGWNDLTVKPKHSAYLAITKIFPVEDHPIIVNVGAGSNAFADVQEVKPESEVGAFLAIGVYLSPHISLIVDHTSGILTVGTSIVPVAKVPLVITLGAFDVNERVPNHDSVSFVGSLAYSFTF